MAVQKCFGRDDSQGLRYARARSKPQELAANYTSTEPGGLATRFCSVPALFYEEPPGDLATGVTEDTPILVGGTSARVATYDEIPLLLH